ncbi:MAG: hypothetical protein WCJ30_22570 [Deltaproteobacteria bacterium]
MRPRTFTNARFRRSLALLAMGACATLGNGCASRVVGDGDGSIGDARTDRGPNAADGGDTVDVPYRDVPVQYDVYREDACPGDAAAGVRMYTCDPFAVVSGCADGQGCYPWIEYPSVPCGSEIYHADCMPVGPTPIDGFCTSGGECTGGLACFVTGSGNRCLQLCHIDGTDPQCPRGREPTDLPDFGACD